MTTSHRNTPYPSPFTAEVEAIIREVDTERIAREEVERLNAHLDALEAPALTEDEVIRYMRRIAAWLHAAAEEE